MNLKDARILITGGTLGIGRATAQLLIAAGAKVAITGRDPGRTEEASRELGALGIAADVSDEEQVIKTFAAIERAWNGLDCLINNAAIGVHEPLVALGTADFAEVLKVNVLGPMMMAQHAAKIFIRQTYGNIVNIASSSALRGYEDGTAYVASKFALRGMSECWRAELRRYNVRVIVIHPSEVTTAFGNPERKERPEQEKKLRPIEIAHTIKAALEMDDRGFIPEVAVWATNPF